MPRLREEYLESDDLGKLIMAAYGLDRDWINDGACVRYMAGQRTDSLNPWWAEWNETYGDIKGEELVRAALLICHDCPAQYECARYAVKGEMRGGVWGMTLANLRWLQGSNASVSPVAVRAPSSQQEALDIIDMAEANRMSTNDVVVELRQPNLIGCSA